MAPRSRMKKFAANLLDTETIKQGYEGAGERPCSHRLLFPSLLLSILVVGSTSDSNGATFLGGRLEQSNIDSGLVPSDTQNVKGLSLPILLGHEHQNSEYIMKHRRLLSLDGVMGTVDNPSCKKEMPREPYYKCPEAYAVPYFKAELADAVEKGRKFLALGLEREQLTKGRLHLAEAMAVAKAEGRILILPPAGESRMGLDRHLPLCTYFDTLQIGEFVDWVTEDFYLSEVERLGRRPEILSLFLKKRRHLCDDRLWRLCEPKDTINGTALSSQHMFAQNAVLFRNAFCIEERPLALLDDAQIDLLQMLRDKSADKDLVVLFKVGDNMFFRGPPAVEEARENITYSPQLHDVGDVVMRECLGPAYLAIHWRTEWALLQRDMSASLMRSCTQGLIWTAKKLLRRYNFTGVFLAADMAPDGRPNSGSFYSIPPRMQKWAQEAIKEIHAELSPVTWDSFDKKFPTLDLGIQGILDKIVSSKANLFLRPPLACSGRWGSFTREIIYMRKLKGRDYPSNNWQFAPANS